MKKRLLIISIVCFAIAGFCAYAAADMQATGWEVADGVSPVSVDTSIVGSVLIVTETYASGVDRVTRTDLVQVHEILMREFDRMEIRRANFFDRAKPLIKAWRAAGGSVPADLVSAFVAEKSYWTNYITDTAP